MLKKGHCDGLKVRTGRLQNLISSSCIGILVYKNLPYNYIIVNINMLQSIWIL